MEKLKKKMKVLITETYSIIINLLLLLYFTQVNLILKDIYASIECIHILCFFINKIFKDILLIISQLKSKQSMS